MEREDIEKSIDSNTDANFYPGVLADWYDWDDSVEQDDNAAMEWYKKPAIWKQTAGFFCR